MRSSTAIWLASTRSACTPCWKTTAATLSPSTSMKQNGGRMPRAFMGSCEALGVPAALEISRSGCGAHAWVFFASRVSARYARRLGTAIISHTCARTRQLKLNSYDRLFPNQDTMPKGGFGNLIACRCRRGHAREAQCVRRCRAAAVPGPVGVPGGHPPDGRARIEPRYAGHWWRPSADSRSSTTKTWLRPGRARARQARSFLGLCRSR